MADWLSAGPESLLGTISAVAADATTAGARRLLRSMLGEAASVSSVTREGARVTASGVRVPFAAGPISGEVTVEATVDLAAAASRASWAGLERVSAELVASVAGGRIELAVALASDASRTPGVVWSGGLEASGRLVFGARALPLTIEARLLVDDDRVYLQGLGLRGPGVVLRGDASVAREGLGLRGRATGAITPATLLDAIGAPSLVVPTADGALAVNLQLEGTLPHPRVALAATGSSLAFTLGRPRWVPPSRVEDIDVRATLEQGVLAAFARGRAGGGTFEAELREELGVSPPTSRRARVAVSRWPARFAFGVLPSVGAVAEAIESALADATFDAALALRGAVSSFELELRSAAVRAVVPNVELRRFDPAGVAFQLEVDLAALTATGVLAHGASGLLVASGRVVERWDVEVRITSDDARAALPQGAAFDLEALDASARIAIAPDGRASVSVGPAVARVLGGLVGLEAEVRFARGHALAGELRARLDDLDARAVELAATLGSGGRARILGAPEGTCATRPRGTAWLPRGLRLSGDLRALASGQLDARIQARSPASDVVARARAGEGRELDVHLEGRLAAADAIDLGLFDGGTLPDREGHIDLALRLAGPPADLTLSGDLHAPTLGFGPRVQLEDVHALVSARGGVAVWGEVRARLAGGRVTAVALVDRDGGLGGMRAHVVLADVDVRRLSEGLAHGVLSAELALEQHGPDDAPLLGVGVLVVRDARSPTLAQRVAGRVPEGLATRNAVAAGELTSRLSLDGASLRLLDLGLPLVDAWIGGDVRLGLEGALEAHLEVHARGLVAVPVRLRGALDDLAPELEVDVVSAALVGAATARARASRPLRPHVPPARHGGLAAAAAAIAWASLSRRARGQT